MTSTYLLRDGLVIDTDPAPTVLGRADVLVQDGRIAAVGPDLASSAAAPLPADAEVIDASGRIVLPGFVDTHRHVWQAGIRAALPDGTLPAYVERVLGVLAPRHTADDVYAGTLAGALECLDSGVTTVVDWSHIQLRPEYAEASVSALRAAGARAVFGFCYFGDGDLDALAAETARVRDAYFDVPDGLLTMAMAALGPELTSPERALREWAVARDLGLPVTTHMGGHGAESAERGMAFLVDHGLMDQGAMYVHANHFTGDDLRRIAASGGTVSVTPGVEAALGLGPAATGRSLAAGVPTGLGADTVVSGPGDMFGVMGAAHVLERGRPDGAGMGFTTSDVLRMATIGGAEAAGLAGVTGSLAPGKQADLVVLRTDTPGMAAAHDPIAAVVRYAGTREVDTVLVAGRIVKRGGVLLGQDVPSLLASLESSAGRLTAA
ncbi:amidohydrolase family protein [Actinomadura litoris]|uniref:Amidohydrolase family protein n=1 Tax=Actinomadura litoris TaxID=2678616 RepID=A0A7K1L628_9ACTN|nr:amidohydrolase family protein [Actinomadura litoris]MUN39877.1 amidohydrolase family protein [Actinomadura litoris]